ncbi:hypothetical protein HMH01_16905 [Halovulum dunhuangense]|uniref:DUF6647 domain-containing protein n=2 Tax=Halovulum dunhuangense TaxID=1505036 RepID=A0A849L6Q8_9RHOB|nr:hypothetical protein [Halovulum dunhuangense]
MPAAAEQRTAPSILDFISLWLQSEYQLGRPSAPPDIVAMSSADLIARRYGDGADAGPTGIMALYDAEAGAILVSEGWTGGTVAEISIIVHEMVHHLQREAGTVFACPAERERLAYRAQDDWLKLFGQDLHGAFGIDPALILVATVCTH